VRERIEIPEARPLNPALVARAVERIDSLYEANGYYLARVRPETTFVGPQIRLSFKIDEGRRLAVSGIRILGNNKVSDGEIVAAMHTKPEGFLWFRKGAFDEDKYAGDLGDRLPELYGRKGYIDFQIVRDTMIVDRENGRHSSRSSYRKVRSTGLGGSRVKGIAVSRQKKFGAFIRSTTTPSHSRAGSKSSSAGAPAARRKASSTSLAGTRRRVAWRRRIATRVISRSACARW
jgi:hypothetical protein